MNTNVKVIGLTRLGIKPKSTVFEEDALTTRSSEIALPPGAYLGGHCAMPPLFLTLPFRKKEQNQWSQVTETYQLLAVFVAYGQGRIRGVGFRMRGMHQPFLKMFLMYTIFP